MLPVPSPIHFVFSRYSYSKSEQFAKTTSDRLLVRSRRNKTVEQTSSRLACALGRAGVVLDQGENNSERHSKERKQRRLNAKVPLSVLLKTYLRRPLIGRM